MVKGANNDETNMTVVLVDCSFSAKKKRKNIESYAVYCAKVAKLEEDGLIEADQNPPAGFIDTFETSNGKKILSIVPHFCECPDKDECHPTKTNVWHQYRKPVYDTTIVPILEYKNYLVDPEYVKLLHSRVNGLIRSWRLAVDECCGSMHGIWGYPWKAVVDQYDWYKDKTEPIMEALSSFTLMPVSHMNTQAVVSTIRGITDDEQADFAIRLGQCKHIKIGVVRHIGKNNVSIVTIFDNNYKHKVAYGKKSIEDLGDDETSQETVFFDTSRFENIIVCPKSCECGGKSEHSICNK
jgi:hypothetical protein